MLLFQFIIIFFYRTPLKSLLHNVNILLQVRQPDVTYKYDHLCRLTCQNPGQMRFFLFLKKKLIFFFYLSIVWVDERDSRCHVRSHRQVVHPT